MLKRGNKIHNAFFQDLCNEPRLAADLLKGMIDVEFNKYLDWMNFTIMHKEYEQGYEHILQLKCDCVCRIQLKGKDIGEDSYLYTIIEQPIQLES